MNIQAMMKQAQQMQKQMLKTKEEIDNTTFTGESSLVKVEVNGKKEVLRVNISTDNDFSSEDMEMLEDMIMLAMNDAFSKVDKMIEEKMGKYGAGLSGLM